MPKSSTLKGEKSLDEFNSDVIGEWGASNVADKLYFYIYRTIFEKCFVCVGAKVKSDWHD